jgi:hypothetical protein
MTHKTKATICTSFMAGWIFGFLLIALTTDNSEIQYCLDALAAVKQDQPVYPKVSQ